MKSIKPDILRTFLFKCNILGVTTPGVKMFRPYYYTISGLLLLAEPYKKYVQFEFEVIDHIWEKVTHHHTLYLTAQLSEVEKAGNSYTIKGQVKDIPDNCTEKPNMEGRLI